jgi:hypothetical protein
VIAGTATSVAGRVQRRQEQKFARSAPVAAPTSSDIDIVANLQHLADLKASGALTDKEYAAAKAKVLGA